MGRVRKPHVAVNAIGRMATHGRQRPRRVILHSTESNDAAGLGDITGIFDFWRRQGRGYGAHVIIDRDGNAGQGAYGNQIVWATYGANTGSLQIEIVGRAKWSRYDWLHPQRRRQLNEVAKWCAWWSTIYGIPLLASTERGVCGHRDFPQGGHWDPGPGFPMWWVRRRARHYKRNGW